MNMTPNNHESTQCAVFDQTPGSLQKKINIVVRPHNTVERIIHDISIQYSYSNFDLLLQPVDEKQELVYLNDFLTSYIYDIPGFDSTRKNYLVLLPTGAWDGNTKARFVLPIKHINKNNTGANNTVGGTTMDVVKNMSQLKAKIDTAAAILTASQNSPETIETNNSTIYSGGDAPTTSSRLQHKFNIISTPTDLDDISAPSVDVTNELHDDLLPHDNISDSLNISPVSEQEQSSDDELALGASASPIELKIATFDDEIDLCQDTNPFKLTTMTKKTETDFFIDKKYPLGNTQEQTTITAPKGYVGLVNQAMTCYLNSLLQALFMTPEFRNALYRWEFDTENESKNIPYQLQKLFLNLQTSPKSSVETTDLTRSFGWDSTEAWQQHDIQELCRVMFDALEHKSKHTKHAHFISNLYEGKMLDYVKCLECNTEKTREDTFLDIPLPVRPFGSNVAYGSIEEALRAFVQPETLDGNNQYWCDNCNKKCDAHKGLKFKTFPYVLTLHLKRFDFDYQTMHRIKLNDRVTFPQFLNLNSFVNATESESLMNLQNGATNATNLDDCSVTDSGSAMEEDNLSSGVVTTASSSQHENDLNEYDDEGIDMSTSTDHRITAGNNKSAALERIKQESGPYLYELFAIMIHSGSASGGHYYAYIKDFENNEWFCFNDQIVTPITQDDIQRSFGGSTNSVYSSVYSSSTNAYMLMYRQVDPKRNEHAIKDSEFPEHIKCLLQKLNDEGDTRGSRMGRYSTVTDLALPDLHKPRVYFYNPSMKKLKNTRVYITQNFDIKHVLEIAYETLEVHKFAPLSHCRLVAFDPSPEEILQSFENISDPSLKELRAIHNFQLDYLLEYRTDNQEFEIYDKFGTTWSVFLIDLTTMAMDGPFMVYSMARDNNAVLRRSIAMRLGLRDNEFTLATLKEITKKAFVSCNGPSIPEAEEALQCLVHAQLRHLTYFYLNVPSTDARSCEIMGMTPLNALPAPSVEVSSDEVDAVLLNSGPSNSTSTSTVVGDSIAIENTVFNRESPLPAPITTPGHESNSEDSSLSDGDRTLVESIQNRGGGDSQVSSTSHSPQLSSPEDETAIHDSYMRIHAFYNGYSADAPTIPTAVLTNSGAQFFHAVKCDELDLPANYQTSSSLTDEEYSVCKPIRAIKLIVNTHLRMGLFKRNVADIIGIPYNYFSILTKNNSVICDNPTNSIAFMTESDTFTIKLGKILEADEFRAKIFFMRLSELNNDTGKLNAVCEWIYNSSTTVRDAKRELVSKLKRIDGDKFGTLNLNNFRFWLKGGRSPITILDDDDLVHNEMRTFTSSEFLIQECDPGIVVQPKGKSMTLFLRRWHPDKLEFDNFQEITLYRDDEFRKSISKITDIPEEYIGYCKATASFPCTNVSVLSINGATGWFTIPAFMDKYPLIANTCGSVFFYKDLRTDSKELTTEERTEISIKEKARLERLFNNSSPTSTTLSPRRERALKIYIDSPQKSNTATSALPRDTSTATSTTTAAISSSYFTQIKD